MAQLIRICRRIKDTFHKQVLHRFANIDGILFCTYPNSNKVIASECCICDAATCVTVAHSPAWYYSQTDFPSILIDEWIWLMSEFDWWVNSPSLIARFMGPTWGPSGTDRTQVGPMLATWTLLIKVKWAPDLSLSRHILNGLTHWGRDKMAAISQTTLSNAFSWMKMLKFWLKFHCS